MNFLTFSIPKQIHEAENFNKNISQLCEEMYNRVQYIRLIIEKTHQHYGSLAKSVCKLAQETQKKLENDGKAFWVISFVKNIQSIYQNLIHQINNNVVLLKTKHNKFAKKRLEMLVEKLGKVNQQIIKYLSLVKQYNSDGQKYTKQCSFFQGWENTPTKYYSMRETAAYYARVNKLEFELRTKLQNIYKMKKQIQIAIKQIRKTIKDYQQLLSTNLNEYKRISMSFKDKPPKIFIQTIIEQLNEEQAENSFRQNNPNEIINISQNIRQSSPPIDKRREIQREYQKQQVICVTYQQFLEQYQNLLKKQEQSLEYLFESKQFKVFEERRQEIGQDMELNEEICIKQAKYIKKLFGQLINILNKVKIFKEITKNRENNQENFTNDFNNLLEGKTYREIEYEKLQEKFLTSNNDQIKLFKSKSNEILLQIGRKFEAKKQDQKNMKMSSDLGTFQQEYFKILSIPFFTQKQQQLQFRQSEHIVRYLTVTNANRLQQISLDLESEIKVQKRQRQSSWCCGFVKRSQKKDNGLIDKFSCALKIGIILIQGQLSIYRTFLFFQTALLTNIFMYSTQLKIPIWDIKKVLKQRYISMMIALITTHGRLQFTSFISDPYTKIMSVIPEKANEYPRFQILDCPKDLKILEQQFQSYFSNSLLKQSVVLNNFQTFSKESNKQLTISSQYYYKKLEEKGFFELKILKHKSVIEYGIKISNESSVVKEIINDCAKNLIEDKPNISQVIDFKNISDIAQKDQKPLFQRSFSEIRFQKSNQFISGYNQNNMRGSMNQFPNEKPQIPFQRKSAQYENQERERFLRSRDFYPNAQSIMINSPKQSSQQYAKILSKPGNYITRNSASISLPSDRIIQRKAQLKLTKNMQFETDTQNKNGKRPQTTDTSKKYLNQEKKEKNQKKLETQVNPLWIILGIFLFFIMLSNSK